MSGQLLHVAARDWPPLAPHTHVVLSPRGRHRAAFRRPEDLRRVVRLVGPRRARGSGRARAPRARSAPRRAPGGKFLASRFAGRRAPLKALLTDQRIVAGIGNIYADEICFRAKLRPDRAGGSLTPAEVAALARAARAVLREAVRIARVFARGTPRYRDLDGELGSYQGRHAVYDRAGEPCRAVRRTRSCGSRSAPGPLTAARAARSDEAFSRRRPDPRARPRSHG